MAEHTPGPWAFRQRKGIRVVKLKRDHWEAAHPNGFGVAIIFGNDDSNARLIAAAPELLEAAELLEKAEHNRQFCDECEDEGEPEACGKCFPAFDDARIKRRLAIAKARGTVLTPAEHTP